MKYLLTLSLFAALAAAQPGPFFDGELIKGPTHLVLLQEASTRGHLQPPFTIGYVRSDNAATIAWNVVFIYRDPKTRLLDTKNILVHYQAEFWTTFSVQVDKADLVSVTVAEISSLEAWAAFP